MWAGDGSPRPASALTLAAGGVAVASGAGTTEVRTIGDRDGDNRLEPGPGDDYIVRQDLGPASPAARAHARAAADLRAAHRQAHRRRGVARAGGVPRPRRGAVHLRLPPARGHLAPGGRRDGASSCATRSARSRSRRIELVMTTGDNTDNTQCNETRWMIDILDGAANGGGAASRRTCGRCHQGRPQLGHRGLLRPAPTAALRRRARPQRVLRARLQRAAGQRGGRPGLLAATRPRTSGRRGRSSSVRDCPGLFERMNEPFRADRLRDLPWYGIFGNHDGLVQGNQPRNPALDAIAMGCVKVTGLPPAMLEDIRAVPRGRRRRRGRRRWPSATFAAIAEDPRRTRPPWRRPDDERRPCSSRREYIGQHFATSGRPLGHGFGPRRTSRGGQGNYAFSPARRRALHRARHGGRERPRRRQPRPRAVRVAARPAAAAEAAARAGGRLRPPLARDDGPARR